MFAVIRRLEIDCKRPFFVFPITLIEDLMDNGIFIIGGDNNIITD